METERGEVSGLDWDVERVCLGRHFLRDLEGLWARVLRLAGIVEEALEHSAAPSASGSPTWPTWSPARSRVDQWEVEIERDCLKVLALHQPVASDLRRVASVLRVNGNLERMGDLARHIAKRVRKLAADPGVYPLPEPLESMAVESLAQVRKALDALAKSDAVLARAVIAGDARVDRHYRGVVKGLKQCIRRDPERVDNWLRLINTAAQPRTHRRPRQEYRRSGCLFKRGRHHSTRRRAAGGRLTRVIGLRSGRSRRLGRDPAPPIRFGAGSRPSLRLRLDPSIES